MCINNYLTNNSRLKVFKVGLTEEEYVRY